MRKAVYLIFLLSFLLFMAFGNVFMSKTKNSFELVSKSNEYTAGYPIAIEFSSKSKKEKPQLFIVHSYGKTLLESKIKKGNYYFDFPENYYKKTSDVSWYLINNNEIITSGTFEILPDDKTKTIIENFLGPRTILCGGKEFSMMVTVPTDSLDNPKKTNTKVVLKYQFLQKTTDLTLKTKDFIAWYNIYSPNKSGKMLVSTLCDKITTKEIESDIYPNLASNFTIDYSRNHEYADGNQITRFTTSTIKDKFNNIVSDGTLVSFIIKTKKATVLKTDGTTINGVASAQILHPDHKETYSVKAFVTGMAESNVININYRPIITSFKYSFTDDNRTIKVGPIKSFMNQLVPDGIKVEIKVFNKDTIFATLIEDTSKGIARFELNKDFYPAKNYRFEITTLGITEKTEIINYEHHK